MEMVWPLNDEFSRKQWTNMVKKANALDFEQIQTRKSGVSHYHYCVSSCFK